MAVQLLCACLFLSLAFTIGCTSGWWRGYKVSVSVSLPWEEDLGLTNGLNPSVRTNN